MSKYDDINFKPTSGMISAAKSGLENRRKAKSKGGLSNKQASEAGIGSGVQRASDIASGEKLSPETVKRVHSFFSRHSAYEKNHEPGNPESRSWVSHQLWGGHAGKKWSARLVEMMKKRDEAEKKK